MFAFCFSFCYSFSKDQAVSICLKTICFLIIFLPAALRFNIGTDYSHYTQGFYRYKNGMNPGKELAWNFIYDIVIKFDLRDQWIFIISSFIFY